MLGYNFLMYLLFEEDGGFKTGTVMADNDASLQVEMASGKRTKIKAANVLMRFKTPTPGELLERAEPLSAEIEAEFLWECCNDGEFSFVDFARDYFGHEPKPEEATAILLRLQASPVHFHRKGKGRFRKAPADILAAALAGLEKKRQQALAIERMAEELKAGRLPTEFAPLLRDLLYAPDRNRPETKALEAACAATGESVPQLMLRCGGLTSPYQYHFDRFLHEHFPKGTGFPPLLAPPVPDGLPLADAPAFSIDDAATTEIDDAFSVQTLPGIGWRVGIHIAAPGLAFAPQSELDAVARARLSTVYTPGRKITMLPDTVVASYTLAAGQTCPAMSLYLTVSDELEITAYDSRAERVRIAANLRHHELEPLFNEETLADGRAAAAPFGAELTLLWRLAGACEGRRGKPSAMQGLHDYNFAIAGDLESPAADPERCRVLISERRRGSPLDKLVAELMIVANAHWGGLLAEKGVPGLYRAQGGGRVRMTTQAAPHEGLGVAQYAWCTSPLRRYADLVNQWQLAACLRGEEAPFKPRSELLFAALRDFDTAYAAYADVQRHLERYWCLRWLRQEGLSEVHATVLRREGMVKLDHLPLAVAVPSLPVLAAGSRVSLHIDKLDELTLDVGLRYVATLAEEAGNPDDAGEEGEAEVVDAVGDATEAAPAPAAPVPTETDAA